MSFYEVDTILKYFDPGDISEQPFDVGHVLFRLGEAVNRVYFVVSGEVHAESYLADGQSITYFRARAGQALGEESLYLDKHIYTGVVSVSNTVVRSVKKQRLLEVLHGAPDAAKDFTSCLATRYADALMHRELLSIRSAEERLFAWLHWQIGLDSKKQEINLKSQMGAIGAELSLTTESIYRAFKALEDSGKITRKDGAVRLCGEN